jgi:heat shock protein HslJ
VISTPRSHNKQPEVGERPAAGWGCGVGGDGGCSGTGIGGSGGCNRYFGGRGFLEGTKDTLRIWRTGSTKMACDGAIMTQEYGFLEELSRVSRYEIGGKELRLYYNEGQGVLRFSRGVKP